MWLVAQLFCIVTVQQVASTKVLNCTGSIATLEDLENKAIHVMLGYEQPIQKPEND